MIHENITVLEIGNINKVSIKIKYRTK